MRIALLDQNQQPLPTAIKSLPLELRYRLRKRLPPWSSRTRFLRAMEDTLTELEAELREQSKRL